MSQMTLMIISVSQNNSFLYIFGYTDPIFFRQSLLESSCHILIYFTVYTFHVLLRQISTILQGSHKGFRRRFSMFTALFFFYVTLRFPSNFLKTLFIYGPNDLKFCTSDLYHDPARDTKS